MIISFFMYGDSVVYYFRDGSWEKVTPKSPDIPVDANSTARRADSNFNASLTGQYMTPTKTARHQDYGEGDDQLRFSERLNHSFADWPPYGAR